MLSGYLIKKNFKAVDKYSVGEKNLDVCGVAKKTAGHFGGQLYNKVLYFFFQVYKANTLEKSTAKLYINYFITLDTLKLLEQI